MINIMENKVLGPIIQQQYEQGRQEGRQEGLHEGQQLQLQQLLSEKFGPLPSWAAERIHSSTAADLDRWSRRILRASTLEETLE